MKLQKISLAETNSFTRFFLDYIKPQSSLKKFYHRFPTPKNFQGQIREKSASFPQHHRDILVQTLQEHYKHHTVTKSVKKNIELLGDKKTFTVTTGHQLNIFTGPLYFIYKIITVINTCRKLKAAYPRYNFVPVYWMASEDHDFEEIKYFSLHGKKYEWETSQKGAVGRFNPASLESLLKEIPGDIALFKKAYLKHPTLSEAVRFYVNELFGSEGLIVLDADARSLKKLFKKEILDDLENHTSKKLVDKTNGALEKMGYEPQVYCRDINFFYLENGLRARIEKVGDGYRVVDSSQTFTRQQIQALVDSEPEKFSPNVILRPLYEETVLPNLAYVGGPAEMVYWLQLQDVFRHYKTPFPILMPRNFALVIDAVIQRKLKKTRLSIRELFLEKNTLFNQVVARSSQHKIKLNGEKKAIQQYFNGIRKQAESVDKTLGPLVGAETQRAIKSLEKIEHKLLKAEKRFQSDKLKQVEAVKDALFPKGGLQERTDNFLNFYQRDSQFIKKLIKKLNPFDFRFNVFHYD